MVSNRNRRGRVQAVLPASQVAWIRSPAFDLLWILSGIPIGLALIWIPINVAFSMFFVLNSAHLISPIVATWGAPNVRKWAFQHWVRFIALPLVIIIVAITLGMTVGKAFEINPLTLGVRVYGWNDYWRPFVLMFPLYFVWNLYHFGSQNYGFLCLYNRLRLTRWRGMTIKWICIISTVAGLALLPKLMHSRNVALFVFGFFVFNHSLSAIGLSSHLLSKHARFSPWTIAVGMLVIGGFGFWLLFMAPGLTMRITMTAVGFRLGLAFVHFLYDRWLYKRGSPIWQN